MSFFNPKKHFPKKPGEFLLRPYVDTTELFNGIVCTLYYPGNALAQSVEYALTVPVRIYTTIKNLITLNGKGTIHAINRTGMALTRAVVYSTYSLLSLVYHLLALATRLLSTIVRGGAHRENWPDEQLYEKPLSSVSIFLG